MPKLNLKQIIIAIVTIIGALLILIFGRGLYSSPPASQKNTAVKSAQTETKDENNKEIKVVSTNPEDLDGSTILPNQTIEITFNQPMENRGEFKNKIEPPADYEIKLSDDRKTAKIILAKPFKLGTGYTLFIKSDTKFDGKKTLDKEIIYHFNTISYKGV
ncbi:MAG: Ig-like domain-containing protein [Candidatus Daviesbacteria bacterium]|nr:Ig-like domain-containing protein [Candidatus Daviesbacteria bacterium]